MSPPRLILASTSSGRRLVLANAGVPFEALSPEVDEAEIKRTLAQRSADGREIAETLAERKACRISEEHRDALVIGADQVMACAGRMFDKPASLEEARAHLQFLRSRQHELISAVCVAQGGRAIWRCTETARLTMHDFDDAFLDRYLAASGKEVLTSVGCYRLEGLGPHLFSAIDGDFFTILGLPLLPLLPFLARHGIGFA